MKVLLFEWLCGGGCWIDQIEFDHFPHGWPFMLKQGHAMLLAVSEDLKLAGHEVSILLDVRMPAVSDAISNTWPVACPEQLKPTLLKAAKECDRVILIAPETDSCLLRCCDWLQHHRDRFLSPDREFVRLTANKHDTAIWLHSRGVNVPKGCLSSDFATNPIELCWPLVIKPNDGAGSESMQFVDVGEPIPDIPRNDSIRIEEFISGTPVSVSALCGGAVHEFLPPTGQQFDRQPFGHYVGAQFPLDADLSARAERLARMAIRALPQTRGYVGIDMVLSDQSESLDAVIEVNPRLTMSYVRLREIVPFNIAERWGKLVFSF